MLSWQAVVAVDLCHSRYCRQNGRWNRNRTPGVAAEIGSAIITLAPGESTGAHKHRVPTYGYILSGSVAVDYGNHGRRVYEAGTAFMTGMDVRHDGVNEADVPYCMGRPAEVASAVYRLCTANLRYVTGTEIFVTGGQHLY
jgi:mannose-6-phosphate isomerase-like protein (cupin superfamily)